MCNKQTVLSMLIGCNRHTRHYKVVAFGTCTGLLVAAYELFWYPINQQRLSELFHVRSRIPKLGGFHFQPWDF